jgi:hypothetical protein
MRLNTRSRRPGVRFCRRRLVTVTWGDYRYVAPVEGKEDGQDGPRRRGHWQRTPRTASASVPRGRRTGSRHRSSCPAATASASWRRCARCRTPTWPAMVRAGLCRAWGIDRLIVEPEAQQASRPELVWTGPEGTGAASRDTSVVVRGAAGPHLLERRSPERRSRQLHRGRPGGEHRSQGAGQRRCVRWYPAGSVRVAGDGWPVAARPGAAGMTLRPARSGSIRNLGS